MISETPNHYSTLEVHQGASKEELRAAYHRLSLKHHPDKNKGNEEAATEKFRQVNEAYSTLTDPEKRFQYDQECKQSYYDQSNQQSYIWSYQPTAFPMQHQTAFPMQHQTTFPMQQPTTFPMQHQTSFPTQHSGYVFRETPWNIATASTTCNFRNDRGMCNCHLRCNTTTSSFSEQLERDPSYRFIRESFPQFPTFIPGSLSSPASSPPPVHPQTRPESYQHNHGRGSTPMYNPGNPVWYGDRGQPR
ncbi:DnaJ domain-containing protein [Xylaria flabelliformis]|nr:DnaJ domain-containing protein [Xylaria flabelliformis]